MVGDRILNVILGSVLASWSGQNWPMSCRELPDVRRRRLDEELKIKRWRWRGEDGEMKIKRGRDEVGEMKIGLKT